MASLPRPLLALLVVVAAFFAAWTLVLKPHSGSASAPAAIPAPVVHHAAPAKHAAGAAKPQAKAVAAADPALSAATRRAARLDSALTAGKVVAVLFYNPAGSDDQADVKVLNALSTHGGRVVKLAVPVSELARYHAITNEVPVSGSPTLVVVDARHRAQTLVGYTDPLEAGQLLDSALAG
jgi:hypothetical protein